MDQNALALDSSTAVLAGSWCEPARTAALRICSVHSCASAFTGSFKEAAPLKLRSTSQPPSKLPQASRAHFLEAAQPLEMWNTSPRLCASGVRRESASYGQAEEPSGPGRARRLLQKCRHRPALGLARRGRAVEEERTCARAPRFASRGCGRAFRSIHRTSGLSMRAQALARGVLN